MTRAVAILPTFRPDSTGGVARHVMALHRHLPAFGWEIAPRPESADLVHTHAMDTWAEIDCYTNHGIYPVREDMLKWQRDANRRLFDNIKLSGRVIAVSQWTARQWDYLTAVTPEIIPNGVDLDDWQNVPAGHWRAKLKSAKRPIVLWGKTHLSEVLDPTPAIEIALRRPDVAVVAPLDKRLLPHAPKNFHCVGPQPFATMQMLLQDCDIYLATTCENHSIQLLEALALGKPALGYAWGGSGETLAGSPAGLLVEPGDLAALVAGVGAALEDAAAMGEAGQALVAERYQWSQIVGRVARVYEEIMDEKETRRKRPGFKCSIIIPCYNKATWVGEAILSAVGQRGAPNYEVIVVDDGSTDKSLDAIRVAVRAAESSGVPIKVIKQKNAGVAAARNHGIQLARGEYICCLDADDKIDPLFLARLSAALDSDPGLGIAYPDFIAFGFDIRRHGAWSQSITCDEYDFERLQHGNIMPCCNLFRKIAWQRAGGYKDINPSWEDYELWLNMGKLGWPARRVPGALFLYRVLPDEGRNRESQGLEWKLRAKVNAFHRDLYPPMVSVVIPCYRHSQFLQTAIDSALAQTFPDLEVVVVDDGNEPAEAQAIAELVKAAGPAVRMVRLNENAGLATARNTGIEAARGTWILPLDADDALAPTFVEKAFEALRLNPREFAYSDSVLWWPDEAREQEIQASEYSFPDLLNKITWSCSILFTKDVWRQAGGYKPQMSAAGGWEDWEFVVTLGEIGICGKRVPEALFRYRQHSAEQMRHGANSKKPALQEAMRRLHAATYRGEFPMACCGKSRAGVIPAQPPVVETGGQMRGAIESRASANGHGEKLIVVRYVGASYGSQTWRTPAGRAYRFGLADPLKQMPETDAKWFSTQPQFQLVTA